MEVKRAHHGTAAACQAQGMHFMVLVAETTGAWEPDASKMLLIVSRAVASHEDRHPAALYGELLQEPSVTVRSFRARAVLRRWAELAEASEPGAARLAATSLLAT